MPTNFNLYAAILLIGGIATFFLSLLLFKRLNKAARWLALLILSTAIWAVAYAMELSSVRLSQMLFWINFEYIGIALIPALWLVFTIRFVGKDQWLTKRNQAAIFFFPVITLILVWTNQWHYLHYSTVSVDSSGSIPLLDITPGPWYHLHTAIFYGCLALGIILLLLKFKFADSLFRKQNAMIMIGAAIPWLVNLCYLFGLRPDDHIDLTPFAFVLTSLFIGVGLLRFSLFDVIPFAREKLVEVQREGILVLDAKDRIIDLNLSMRKFLKNPPEIVGVHISKILKSEYLLSSIRRRVLTTQELKSPLDDKVYEVALNPLVENLTGFKGTVITFWDITERKRFEEKLKQQTEELRHLNQLKDKMFSIIAHDLRSPLANLVDILNLAQAGISQSEFSAFLPMLSSNVSHTSVLLENLLYWSRSQLQGETIQRTNVELRSVVTEKILLLEKKAQEKSISIYNSVPEDVVVYADLNMTQLVIRNLISNAVKFCNEGDAIEIYAQTREARTLVCVSDTGIGIAEDALKRILGAEMFSTTGTQSEKGTGIGLKLCKDFVEKNGGRLWIESQVQKGTRVFFELQNGNTAVR